MNELVILSGPNSGVRLKIDPLPFIIGRDRQCDLCLRDPTVSRQHCKLELCENKLILVDLESANPVRVNGKRIQSSPIEVGDEITIGPYRFRLAQTLDTHPIESDEGSTVTLKQCDSMFIHAMENPSDAPDEILGELVHMLPLMRTIAASRSALDLKSMMANYLSTKFQADMIQIFIRGFGSEIIFDASDNKNLKPMHELLIAGAERNTGEVLRADFKSNATRISGVVLPLRIGNYPIGSLLIGTSRHNTWPKETIEILTACAQFLGTFVLGRLQLDHRSASDNHKLELTGQFIGNSPRIEEIKSRVRMIAPTDKPVLIIGETGTGKELIASMVHTLSARKDAPFICLNCAAIPVELLASEIFGYERGAFTGANKTKLGLLEHANNGTLFLDEIGDLRLESQAALLRVLETGMFRRLAGKDEISVNIRLVSATNKDLTKAIQEGKFREDLYHRIRGLNLNLPSLRERSSDIMILARHFTSEECTRQQIPIKEFGKDAQAVLTAHQWPGNVRELKSTVELAVILSQKNSISAEDIETVLFKIDLKPEFESLEAIEREHITRSLERAHNNVAIAARSLGISKSTLYTRLKDYGITTPK